MSLTLSSTAFTLIQSAPAAPVLFVPWTHQTNSHQAYSLFALVFPSAQNIFLQMFA